MVRYIPRKIIIDTKVRDSLITHNILNNLPGVPVEYLADTSTAIDAIRGRKDPLCAGKKVLLLTENRGRFLKSCPGTKEYICCGYQILNFATNCNLECSYCILQSYLNNPAMVVYANTKDMLTELEDELSQDPESIYRIGTGEFTDSLALDHLTGFTKLIVPYFAHKENVILELKTKTDNIGNLIDLQHNGNTIVSWSLNTEEIAKSEELFAPSIADRIDAAFKCQKVGYKLGFHFDPLIYYPGWEKGYQKALKRLFAKIETKNVSWISLGCFRFLPELKRIIQKRFPKSKILYNEFIPGMDGKMRYFKPIRIEMYSMMLEWIRDYDPKLCVYLCMESHEVWRKVFREDRVENSENLAKILDGTGDNK
ncbi:MAG: spore photoproduct lyase family protein [Thermodesulfobacteriota bacterium]